MAQSTTQTSKAGNPLAVAVAWLLVGVPLAWGVSQTFIKSLALFR
jgi:hypothetical protein